MISKMISPHAAAFLVERSKSKIARIISHRPLIYTTGICQGIHFGIKGRHMLGAIVVSKAFNPEFLHHLRALLRPAFLGIEGNDAPRDEVVAVVDIGGACQGREARGDEHEDGEETWEHRE